MHWVLLLFAALLAIEALQVRARLGRLGRLGEARAPAVVVAAPGVGVDAGPAGGFLEGADLDLVYLVPERVDAAYAWRLGHVLDLGALQGSPISLGVTAGHAFALRPELAERAQPGSPATLVDFGRAARDAKAYAGRRVGAAVVPGLAQVGAPLRDRPLLEAVYGVQVYGALIGPPLTVGLLLVGIFAAPWAALVAVVAYFAQLPIALGGGPLQVGDLRAAALGRVAYELRDWWALLKAPRHPPDAPDPIASRRPWYEAEIAAGVERFRGPRATACLVCGGSALTPHLTVPDLFQSKPGTFSISRCADCGHLFQDPQLTPEGLGFYYRDFYDGLGADEAERGFVAPFIPYEGRTRTVTARVAPKRWLDVGCGHGHWCRVAAELVPDCRFEGLDQSDGVDVALRRGWIAAAHHGAFPAVAATLEPGYDVVSMSHYLEHTRDPRAELAAAASLVAAGGYLFVEVPEPTGVFARWLRGAWLPWLQPQHLHLFSPANLERLLREAGFEPTDWLFGAAHHQHDFSMAVFLVARRFAPRLDVPWRSPPTTARRLGNALVWSVAGPLMIVGGLLDLIWTVPARKLDQTSTLRVLARRMDT